MGLDYVGPEPTDDNNITRRRDFPLWFPLAGQWLLDPNEVNGWGVVGPYDNTNTQDLGNVGATTWSSNAGGIMFPFPVKITRFKAVHQNNATAAQAWGWVLGRTTPVDDANAVQPVTFLLDEVAANEGNGPRDYSNTRWHITDVDSFDSTVIPEGDILTLAVSAPTADGTNRYVRVQSGFLLFERV